MNTDALLRKGRHIDAIGAGICLVLTVGLYVACIVPLTAARDQYAADKEACVREREHAQNLEASLRRLHVQLNEIRRRAEENAVHLRPPSTAPLHVAHISRLAAEAGLQVDDMRTGDPAPGPYATMVPVHLAGSGTYSACMRFLRRLRETLPETCVLAFALTGEPNDTTGAAALTMDLTWHATLPASQHAGTAGTSATTVTEPAETPDT
jgi:Tfp pilus assembly protein PilO